MSNLDLSKPVLAMYDIRGIQNYIYKTAKVQDAIGASAIVECILPDSLKNGVKNYCENGGSCTYTLEWAGSEGPFPYASFETDVQVLYIGGGNALVCFSTGTLCVEINRFMSKYVLDQTYSLQLAVAIVQKTEKYSDDYANLFREMIRVKAEMVETHPLGALPVMDIEIKTGLPKSCLVPAGLEFYDVASRETYLKKLKERKVRDLVEKAKRFDTYIEGKGEDSTIGVVHIDGNNMGLRIRELVQDKETYDEAVNTMRQISFQITHSYQSVYESMEQLFNRENQDTILKILVAGDDITYICKGKAAIASVEYFCREISKQTMNLKNDQMSINKYGFSVCAGIAYIGSHFPFSIGYEVAEKCCDSAKSVAKEKENMLEVKQDGKTTYKVGNWFDYQFCKNVQTGNLDLVREKEYVTGTGEELLIRPYEFPMPNKKEKEGDLRSFSSLKKNLEYFLSVTSDDENSRKLPRSHAKTIRNFYSRGASVIEEFAAFLKSRGWSMPDGSLRMYSENKQALWYDSLELIDQYVSLDSIAGKED